MPRNAKGSGRIKIVIALVIIILIIVSAVGYFESVATPLVKELAEADVQAMIVSSFIEANAKIKKFSEFYESFFSYEKNDSGEITLIKANTPAINSLSIYAQEAMQKSLDKITDYDVQIPTGAFTGLSILADKGHPVSINIAPVGVVNVSIGSYYYTEGINQTIHRLIMRVTGTVRMLVPMNADDVAVSMDFILSEDVILGRGGDQAVVHHYNSEIKYFGGKTQSIESRNKVKVKGTADSIINFITSSSNVIVMGHKNMDMDAFGSCLAVKAICESFSKKCTIAGTKDDCEEKVRIAANSTYVIKELFANYKTLIEEEIQEKTLLIVVDVSNPDLTIYPDIIDKCNKVIVIDHHRRSEKFIEGAILSYNDPSASSASELLAELIKYSTYSRDIKIDKQEATFLYSGILLDTNHFKSLSVGIRTFEACAILKEYGADNIKAENYLKDDYEMFTEINEIVYTRKVYKADTVWYCKAEKPVMNDSTLSKAANQCMDLSGVKSVFVIGKIYNGDVKISARSDGTVNVQKICEKMGGGGHFGMASCRFKDKTVDEVENILISTLNDNLNEALSE